MIWKAENIWISLSMPTKNWAFWATCVLWDQYQEMFFLLHNTGNLHGLDKFFNSIVLFSDLQRNKNDKWKYIERNLLDWLTWLGLGHKTMAISLWKFQESVLVLFIRLKEYLETLVTQPSIEAGRHWVLILRKKHSNSHSINSINKNSRMNSQTG